MIKFLSKRGQVSNFIVMDLFEEARNLSNQGNKIIHFEAGQPTAKLPNIAFKQALNKIKKTNVSYTNPLGLELLKKKISNFYLKNYKSKIDYNRIIITFGSSGAFILAFLSAFDKGDTIGVTVPNYPAYKNMIQAFDLKMKPIFCNSKKNFEYNFKNICKYKNIDGLLISNPLNPTGAVINKEEINKISVFCKKNNIRIIADEIYHGIDFTKKSDTFFNHNKDSIIINSFSKYFLLTGWRIGWMVCPDNLYSSIKNLAPNLFVAPPTISQYVALSSLNYGNFLNKIVKTYKKNMELLYTELPKIGFRPVLKPEGSFYLYADISKISNDSEKLCKNLLKKYGLVLTPGIDFDSKEGKKYVRFCYSYPEKEIIKGIKKLNSIFN
ncbi:MAG: Aspartate aminotransferase [Alphaproteobacteria bacterium MarineAlpha6_Bin4]|nr:MAG: Aspartate aminotransferase [Alphaproteobacteria bacterium MarineAlpha6_Bin3]PPR37923.1 MAG: Aspartate aminotransferase [Alphaproteobacteria bacterium MarineAlpha6_Bin4]|tara:strand:- start:5612 stop:6757 length:1146 start_codon:yes stop_codon:yes gene_type:complete